MQLRPVRRLKRGEDPRYASPQACKDFNLFVRYVILKDVIIARRQLNSGDALIETLHTASNAMNDIEETVRHEEVEEVC
jgi:hypothetical protein